MIRLLLLCIHLFGITLVGVAAMKITLIYMTSLYYGTSHPWSRHDIVDILVDGSLMGSVYSIFAIVRYIRVRDE